MSSGGSSKSISFRFMKPKPPPTLGKETVGVWTGWCNMGDREVAREAAAKGLHIQLAVTFLSHRTGVDAAEAERWFREEVGRWGCELLQRGQIFKASHILANIGVDPGAEFSKVFYETTERELREYVGAHLAKTGSLDANYQNLAVLLNIIYENALLILKFKSPDSIKELDLQSSEWRAQVATILFLRTEDVRLVPFLEANAMWKHLLSNNDSPNLLLWINLRYSADSQMAASSGSEVFKKFPITSEMLNSITENSHIGEIMLNELSKFGVFLDSESGDIVKILKRLTNLNSIDNIYEILAKSSANLNIEAFFKLFTNYCIKNNYFSILNVVIKDFNVNPRDSNDLQLICDFRSLVEQFTESNLLINILTVCKHLSSDAFNYFNKNPLILLSLIVLQADFIELVSDKSTLMLDGVNCGDFIPSLLDNLPILNAVCHNYIQTPPQCNLTMYNLLDTHLQLNCANFFKFRFTDGQLPTFSSPDLAEHAYCKTLNYKFYLRQARPGIAAKHFVLCQQEAYGGAQVGDRDLDAKVLNLAISNFMREDISASCVAFLAMIGRDPSKVRVALNSAKILARNAYSTDLVLYILSNAEDAPYTLQNHLETIIMEEIEQNALKTGADFIRAIESYEIIIQHSKQSKIKLPELFLKHCASLNLWLPFLIFAQVYKYPLDQLKLLIQFFKSSNLLEHLTHGVVNDVQVSEKNVLIGDRNSRSYLLSKVGFRQNVDSSTSSSSLTSQSSFGSGEGSGSDFFEIDISNIKATLLQTLIRCQNSPDPPKALLQACQLYRNPLLAVFATSYEPDSFITNWLTWLAVSCDLCQTFTNYETIAICGSSVTKLLEDCMKNEFPKALQESFEIFLPDNPLKVFIAFLYDLTQLELNIEVGVHKLQSYRSLLKNTRKNSIIAETDHEMTYLSNRIWIETTSFRLLSATLDYNIRSLYEQIQVIDFLIALQLERYFVTEVQSLDRLSKILKAIELCHIQFEIGLCFDEKTSRQAVLNCIDQLLAKQHFDAALTIAMIENLPPDLILIRKFKSQITNNTNNMSYWQVCEDTFAKYEVTADCVVDFYLEYAEKVHEPLEKFTIMKLAWNWATKFELSNQYEIEKRMWLSFLFVDEKCRNLDCFTIDSMIFVYVDIVEVLESIEPYKSTELSKDLMQQIEKIVLFVLNKENFWLALRLQRMFNVSCPDLETLKLCHSLAEGLLLPHQLNHEQRLIFSTGSNYIKSSHSRRRPLLSARFSSFSSASYSPANMSMLNTPDVNLVDSAKQDTLVMLKVLSEHLHQGSKIGFKIFMMYRISINIEIPYEVIAVTEDYMKILKDALDDDCMNKYDVVHDFISVYNWSKTSIANFISGELISAISHYVKYNLVECRMWDLNLKQDFLLVLQLIQDNCSTLGHNLYAYSNALYKSQIESDSVTDYALLIELLIRAHDCFTADCNMEGIAMILKKSKEIISNLLNVQDWRLIVRLATGVARYTEMKYVFQILIENDQFEFLLRKDLRKDNTLKVALLDYLRKFCPENKDVYKLVALHFTLFSEVALLWEREAHNGIKNLISISKLEMENNKLSVEEEPFVLFANTESTRKCLHKAMEDYKHATDFHLQGEILTKAMNSARQAELIALQLGLLCSQKEPTICLLNLTTAQVALAISGQLSFEQGLIVAEAYNFHPDWSSILYEQYFVCGNETYFEAFCRHLPIGDSLVQDISRKFINSNVNSIAEIRAMKNLLCKLRSPHIKYRIASELGFTDLLGDLIASGQLVYLRDTVWKRGYKN